jgi:hypothetical protein
VVNHELVISQKGLTKNGKHQRGYLQRDRSFGKANYQ